LCPCSLAKSFDHRRSSCVDLGRKFSRLGRRRAAVLCLFRSTAPNVSRRSDCDHTGWQTCKRSTPIRDGAVLGCCVSRNGSADERLEVASTFSPTTAFGPLRVNLEAWPTGLKGFSGMGRLNAASGIRSQVKPPPAAKRPFETLPGTQPISGGKDNDDVDEFASNRSNKH